MRTCVSSLIVDNRLMTLAEYEIVLLLKVKGQAIDI